MPSPAREAAFDILLRVEQQQAYASELLHSDRLDRTFATGLRAVHRTGDGHACAGARGWIWALARCRRSRWTKLDPEVLTALRLGAYQIGFLRLPARAAVNESVELVKRARRRYSVPFVNAVLRKLADKPELMEPAPFPRGRRRCSNRRAACASAVAGGAMGGTYGIETRTGSAHSTSRCRRLRLRLRDPAAEEELQREGIELKPGALLSSARRVVKGDVTHTRGVSRRACCHSGRGVATGGAAGRKRRALAGLLRGAGRQDRDHGGAQSRRGDHCRRLHPHRAALLQERLASLPNVTVMMADATELAGLRAV